MTEPKPKKPVQGVNDLVTISPDAAAMWHPEKNSLKPTEIMAGAKCNVWWLGKCGHEWYNAPRYMTYVRNGVQPGCPVCKGRQVLVGFNDLASKNPAVAAEWHPTKNASMSPKDVTYSSAKKVWWYSDVCGHEWQDAISERVRVRSKKGCKVCNGVEIHAGVNDLATTHPDIAALWHPSKNKLTPQEVMAGARTKKYWWLGACGHEWEAPPVRMSRQYRTGSGCPYCCGKKILVGFNDLATTQPELLKEWHPSKNVDVLPTDISQWDDNKVWWQCSVNFEHEWMAVPRGRSRGKGCPYCVSRHSKPELELFEELKKVYPDTVNGSTINVFWGKINVAEVDIFVPSLNVIVEYDGWYWHKQRVPKDTRKTKALLDAGYKVIRVRVLPLPFLDMKHEDLVQVAANDGEDAKELADKILKKGVK